MQRRSSYENIHYNGAVNVIDKDAFPQTFPLHWHNHVEIAVWPEQMAAGTDESADRDSGKETGRNGSPDRNAAADGWPELRVNQVVYRMKPGDILFIWPGEVHEVIENTSGSLIGLQFPVVLFAELPDFKPFFHFFRNYHRISESEEPELTRKIMAHITRMLSARADKDTFSGVQMVICLYEMFMAFGTYIKNMVPEDGSLSSVGAGKAFEKIRAACSYIIDNCEHELTLEAAAAQAGFSTCYFSRIFKQFTNYNFVEYLALQRIKKARLLLSDPEKSITEVSYQAGFKSISTFNRVFRQYRGCSPSEYRKYYLSTGGII